MLKLLTDRTYVRLLHLLWLKKLPNLNAPQTFNEKVAWRKLFQRNPMFTVFSDKVAVKSEIAKLVGAQYVNPTLWVGTDPKSIPFDTLTPPYVIKANHCSRGIIFVRAAVDADRQKIISHMERLLRLSYARVFREWGYLNIPRKVMVERIIDAPGEEVPRDYKFFVYDGTVHFIQVDADRFKQHTRNLYDRDWNLIPGQFVYANVPVPLARPADLHAMVGLAEKIGSQFDFVRIDLYSTSGGIFFGEATFYPEAGIGTFTPTALDRGFGERWKIGIQSSGT